MTKGGISISFLDTLTCGIGAIVIIFIIFATLEHSGEKVTLISEEEKMGALVIPMKQAILGKESLSAYMYRVKVSQRRNFPFASFSISGTNNEGIDLVKLDAYSSDFMILIENPKKLQGKVGIQLDRSVDLPVKISIEQIIGPEGYAAEKYIIPVSNKSIKPFLFSEGAGLYCNEKYKM